MVFWIGTLVLLLTAVILLIVLLARQRRIVREAVARNYLEEKRDQEESQRALRREVAQTTAEALQVQSEHLGRQLFQQEKRLESFTTTTEQKLELIRATVETKLQHIQVDNNHRLDEMRALVDEKLQKTLEDKMNESFKMVSERLEQVYKGLGEMQNLANGVGDLKRVLSNVKTRGILGEIQLGSILEEILAPDQYDVNVQTKAGSRANVEYAIKLPSEEGEIIYLPIDAKFPADAYGQLMEAYDSADRDQVDTAWKVLRLRIRSFAEDIQKKYLDPPNTTDFAIMFLPFEGLYAEVVNRGMVEELQRDYQVNIAGPSTMAALLNSLQMGFRTFAIQKRSGEVWKVLEAVKTEFRKFSEALEKTRTRLRQADDELEQMVGARTRAIEKSLRSVATLPEQQSQILIEDPLPEDEIPE